MNINRIFLILLISCSGFSIATAQVIFNVGINQPAALLSNAGQDIVSCNGDTAQIGALPSGGTSPYSYAWSPSTDLSSATVASPLAYPTTTTGYVQMVTDSNNCTSVDTVLVSVEAVSAAFSSSSNLLVVSFTDNSNPIPAAWNWDFGDGNSSSSQNPTYTYSAPGVYIVCLTSSSAGNCTSMTCDTITVVDVGFDVASLHEVKVYPNPYRGQTRISYTLDAAERVRLEVFSISGQKVTTIVDNEMQNSGQKEYRFSAKSLGHAAGIYIVRLQIGAADYSLQVVEYE